MARSFAAGILAWSLAVGAAVFGAGLAALPAFFWLRLLRPYGGTPDPMASWLFLACVALGAGTGGFLAVRSIRRRSGALAAGSVSTSTRRDAGGCFVGMCWVAVPVFVLQVLLGLLLGLFDLVVFDQPCGIAEGAEWTAFQRVIDYRFIADTDTSLYVARSLGDRSTWVRLAPHDLPLRKPMRWRDRTHLVVPAEYQDGCLRGIDNVVIEWDPR